MLRDQILRKYLFRPNTLYKQKVQETFKVILNTFTVLVICEQCHHDTMFKNIF